MIDKAAYVGMNGAQGSMRRLQILTNNLANVNTTGFRGDMEVTKPYNLVDNGMQTRIYSTVDSTYTDFSRGPILNTMRSLDVAMTDKGFITVQSKSGEQAYTRAGSLQITKDGFLTTNTGELVLGNNGPINIPQAQHVDIADDGTVSALLVNETDVTILDRILLTSPDEKQLQKQGNGLFVMNDGTQVKRDPNLTLMTGALEGSNVNPIEAMAQLIDLTRNYEMHTSVLKHVVDNATMANQLLDIAH